MLRDARSACVKVLILVPESEERSKSNPFISFIRNGNNWGALNKQLPVLMSSNLRNKTITFWAICHLLSFFAPLLSFSPIKTQNKFDCNHLMLNLQKAEGIQLIFILRCWMMALTSLNVDAAANYRCDSWKERSKIFSIYDEKDLLSFALKGNCRIS